MVVSGGDIVEDSALGGEDAMKASPAEPEGEVDVFIVRSKIGIVGSDLFQGRGAIEGA